MKNQSLVFGIKKSYADRTKQVLSRTYNSIRDELLLTASTLARSSALNDSSVPLNGTKIQELFSVMHVS
ncbi:MAG TPA: hypothetical protein VFS97_14615 [Nitrososphaeraceae archaeon]|nr:hypothetical protein [Nitrososphaeraceae archaeon]